ncbi:MAG: ribonucleoside triphosphate reductase [Pseudodesulfovibrio sp.]|uniref:Anaerobic ribonucleoside-triphosphate reductase n=1 Tax=Pseudodesulfovibrio aespoeensis (strain ATCC 700646 / DSM 10631 / Aspo-2) TaxID=643562 RepID=E6VSK3_PSEA9|nr:MULTISPECIES: ribonucleoside triphosphate reductase [Pseudodesulfovibrio]MBU4377867.1 ribonucleoside triphosphate reductase [Pseudomonadota bacterium]ADU61988.1 anaerobic ribonucleoside-triphosphate reductase [Pseudodesulfovibrio aespoeensis Aspo-2]MBU4476317.1 ribonucleoside triphosphate reductase [Pseudomonadota bacterium]MBU4516042.1 ribonucleoside triphosphate reductase [Pseudomonadota bacterium]MBU4522756.1 ribonucleoside triphosphate reductase [Pseudomonadota bacterium]
MPTQIIKRDGRIETWSTKRIGVAIFKALKGSGIKDPMLADRLAGKVEAKLADMDTPEQEQVQDMVQQVLMEARLYKVAERYILYREKRRELRTQDQSFMDIVGVTESYLDNLDWRVSENSNMVHSFQGLILHMAGSVQARYVLEKYPEEVRMAHNHGYFHIHDLSFGLAGYCSGWSLRDLLLEGFNLRDRCSSTPAKHFDAACGQIVNFLGTLQNEWAGAQAFNNVDTYLAPFVRHDGLDYAAVKQQVQKLLFNLNATSRWGGQSPFTNFTFDVVPPAHIAGEAVILGGKLLDSTYGEYALEMALINRAFLEVMLEGDAAGRIFSFPIPTYNVTKDFPWESEVGKLLLKMTAKYGAPYFQNFINSDLNPEDVRSMCCRLQMDLREIRKKTGGLFGAGDLTGSVGVVTLNLPKLAYLAHNEEDFFELLSEYAELAMESLEFKRKIVEKNLEAGMFPYSRRYLKNGFKGHFSTIGLIGGHEACVNLLGKGMETPSGLSLMQRTLNHLRRLVVRFQEETGNLYNLEATPGEGTCYRLAKIDRELYADIHTSGGEVPYYTNSTLLPVGASQDVFFALEHQNELQPLYNGGTVFHTFLGEAAPDEESVKNFLLKAMSKTKIPYISVTPTFSVCDDHGYIYGEHFTCPTCDRDTEVYTRVVGYYRPVGRWNKGKQEEYKDRVEFSQETFCTA